MIPTGTKALYGALRMNAKDVLPRVVNMNWWRTTDRRERRRHFKKILLNRRIPT